MTDPQDNEEDELLIEAVIHLLDAKKHRNYFCCLSCGEPISVGAALICSECLDGQCDVFGKIADLPEKDGYG